MRKLKYFSVLMLVGLLTLTGCSFGGKKLSVEERLEKALVNLASADSFTAKLSMEGEAAGEDMDISALLKLAKDKNNYNLYFNLEASADSLDDDLSIESYILTSKKSLDLYLKLGYSWDHLKIDNSDIENGFNLDVSEVENVDEKEIKKAVKDFKKVKEGKTRNGITEIIVTIDADDVEDLGSIKLEDDVEVSFFVDSKNNLTKIKFDLSEYSDEIEDGIIIVEFKKINDTKVRVPKDVEEDADEIEVEDLLEEIMDLVGLNNVYDDDDADDDDDDDDDDDYNFDDYSSDEILYDVLLSASLKSCYDGSFKVDFKNYNDELLLYDDDYDIKRIEDGELTFTKKEDSYSCNVEVTRDFVIDGKKCTITDMDSHKGECK